MPVSMTPVWCVRKERVCECVGNSEQGGSFSASSLFLNSASDVVSISGTWFAFAALQSSG